MHISKKTQIIFMRANKTLTRIFDNYTYFANIILPKVAAKLPQFIEI